MWLSSSLLVLHTFSILSIWFLLICSRRCYNTFSQYSEDTKDLPLFDDGVMDTSYMHSWFRAAKVGGKRVVPSGTTIVSVFVLCFFALFLFFRLRFREVASYHKTNH